MDPLRPPSLYAVEVRDITRSQAGAWERADAIETQHCVVCGCRAVRPRFSISGMEFQVVECLECGLGMLFPLPSPDDVLGFYPKEYYGSGGDKFAGLVERVVRLVGARHSRFLARQGQARQTKPGARILDVGCGRGVALSALAQCGFETYGFDIVHDAVEGIDPRFQVKIAPSLIEAGYPQDYFDKVMLWHVLEHAPDPRDLLLEVHRILKPNGTLVVAVPNFSSLQSHWAGPAWFHLDLPRHLYHFPVSALRSLLGDCGFLCRSEHHFSLRQNPFGWVQSALNRVTWLPRNGLYTLLHRRNRDESHPFSAIVRLQFRTAFWLLTPPAVLLSIFAAIVRRGATVHIVATKGSAEIGTGDSERKK